MKVKKIPERRCLGCNTSFPKSQLIRVVRTPEGAVELDVTGRKNGRGAYICKSSGCFKAARKKNRFSVNLDITVPDEVLDRIQSEIEAFESEAGNGE